MKTYLPLLAFLLLPSCSFLESSAGGELSDVKLPVAEAQAIAAAIVKVLAEADADGDGYVSGLAEFLLLIRAAEREYLAQRE